MESCNCSLPEPVECSSSNDGSISAAWLLLPQMAISLLGWSRTLLALNRFRLRISRPEFLALVLFVSAGLTRCVTALATRRAGFAMQILAAGTASLMVWAGFILIFNNSFDVPSGQQWHSMVLVIVVSGMWEVHSRIMVNLSA